MNFSKVIRSVTVQYIGKVIGLIISIVTVGILTRYLGVSNYGEYTALLAIAGLVVTIADFGFFWSTIQGYLNQSDKAKVVREIIGIKLVITILITLISLLIIRYGGFSEAVKQTYWVLIIFVVSSSLNNILVAVYQSEYRMVLPTIYDVLARLIALILIYYGIVRHFPLSWFILSASVSAFLNFFLNWLSLKKVTGLIFPKVIGFSWAFYYRSIFVIGVVQLFAVAYYKTDIVILSWLKPSHDVGIYGAAAKVVDFAMIGATLYVSSIFPALVASFQKDRQKFLDFIGKSFLILSLFALPVGVLGKWFAQDIIRIIGGGQFVGAYSVHVLNHNITTSIILALLLIFVALYYLGIIFSVGLLATNRLKKLAIINFSVLALNIFLNLLLIPHYSNFACALVIVITQIVATTSLAYYFVREYRLKLPWLNFARICLALIPALIFVIIFKSEGFVIRFFGTAVIYLIFVTLLLPRVKVFFRNSFLKTDEKN